MNDKSVKPTESANPSAYTYLALGDSYTIGESVKEKNRWPNQLQKTLNQENIDLGKPQIIAQTGWRTDQLLAAAKAELEPTDKFDIVSLLIGVNNEFQGKTPVSFESEFESCLKYAIDHCTTGAENVFVLSIPDYGYTPYGESSQKAISKRIDQYNEICKKYCAEYDVLFLNITPISRRGLTDINLVAGDDLHPSAAQYNEWVNLISEKVKNLILN